MKRENTVTWVDCNVITRKCHELVEELMKYQMHTWPDNVRGQSALEGDRSVVVSAIYLRDQLIKLIEKSNEKQAKAVATNAGPHTQP